ncbi:hypothetical protein K8I28_13240 [bacterium]|nr:hypothetical protein [bacterium]
MDKNNSNKPDLEDEELRKFLKKYSPEKLYSEGVKASEKPETCPECGSSDIADIMYGLPVFDESLRKNVDRGNIRLGGCVITGFDAQWQCRKCELKIYMKK